MNRGPDGPWFFGRRKSRKLRPGRSRLIENLLPRLRVSPPIGSSDWLDPAGLFAQKVAQVWLEIGFGGGEHLVWQAKAHPEIGHIGCEPFVNGVARLLSQIEREKIANIRIFDDAAAALLNVLPEASIGRIFVLFPDPWPKKRHHKRRFVSSANLDQMARFLKDGAEFRFATDDMDYLRWTLHLVGRHDAFAWLARGPRDWREKPSDWPDTRYETKARAGLRACVYLRFQRLPRSLGGNDEKT